MRIPRQPTRRLPIRHQGRHRGATATEYILILALVVLPLAALTPMAIRMIKVYSLRNSLTQLPFP